MEGLILGRHPGAPHLDSSQAVNASSRLGTLERTFAPRVGDWIQKRRDRAFRVIERDERRLPSDPCMRLMAQAIPTRQSRDDPQACCVTPVAAVPYFWPGASLAGI